MTKTTTDAVVETTRTTGSLDDDRFAWQEAERHGVTDKQVELHG
jgi:hypothetical protein